MVPYVVIVALPWYPQGMTTGARTETITALAYPTLREAATMLSVAPSTLSRQRSIEYIPAGGRDHRIPVTEVLRLTQHFRRRSIDEVAFELLAYCRTHVPAMERAVTTEIDASVAAVYAATPAPSIERFLRDARRLLPDGLFGQVAQAVLADEAPGRVSGSPRGRRPAPVTSPRAAAPGRSARPKTASTPRARQPA